MKIWKNYTTKQFKAMISNMGDVEILEMPRHGKGIRILRDRKHIGSKLLFHIVYEIFVGEIPDGYVLHHIDENKLNDSLDNLKLMPDEDHRRWHAQNRSKETLKKLSDTMKILKKGAPNWITKLSEEEYEEYCKSQSEKYKGENNPFYNQTHTKEVRERISLAHKGKSPANKGKKMGKYYNNGTKYKMFYSEAEAIAAGYPNIGKKCKENNIAE